MTDMEHDINKTKTVWLPIFFKIYSFVFNRRTKLIQVWNNVRVNKMMTEFFFFFFLGELPL